ncbi:MAG: zeta toxin family protein [Melioribacteraceae bacterium]
MPQIFLIGGPNGAGKTTSAMSLLPDFLGINEFVNADTIAFGLSAFNSATVSFSAGKIMLRRISELIEQKKSFAFETTFASKTFVPLLHKSKMHGYTVRLIYIWLHSVELAKERVKLRVESGGHNVPLKIIERRFINGRINFVKLYMPIADEWSIFDNSEKEIKPVAHKVEGKETEITDKEIFNKIVGL